MQKRTVVLANAWGLLCGIGVKWELSVGKDKDNFALLLVFNLYQKDKSQQCYILDFHGRHHWYVTYTLLASPLRHCITLTVHLLHLLSHMLLVNISYLISTTIVEPGILLWIFNVHVYFRKRIYNAFFKIKINVFYSGKIKITNYL